MRIFARTALLPDGWHHDVHVDIGPDGRIAAVTVGEEKDAEASDFGLLLPAPVNAHSHAFQRAMAGLTEFRGPTGSDSFWTWRKLMFRFLDALRPEDVGAITAFVQMEMLEAGYATNVEFHYLHHQPGGAPYDTLSELSQRVAEAAKISGIGLTLVPVHYQQGGCDGRPLGPGQIRFGNDIDRFQKLLDEAREALSALPKDAGLGLAPHSIRAVPVEVLREIDQMMPDGPIHMHLAEQVVEVEEVQAHLGARPVDWALANMPIDDRWCLIHCTQMVPSETAGLAASGAIAGLCPITESNLGDGIFDGVNWFDHGGAIAIGSDSNIRISLSEELRTLEYSQRLRDRSRAALATADHSVGRHLYDACLAGGARAAGRETGQIAPGLWADLLALDADHCDLATKRGDQLLDSFIFAGSDLMVRDVWSAGRHLVRDGSHIRRPEIEARYRKTMHHLGDAL